MVRTLCDNHFCYWTWVRVFTVIELESLLYNNDITGWEKPVKLNRKDLRRAQLQAEEAERPAAPPQAVGPMLGPDGKPVIGMDGRVVMVDAEGRPIRAANGNGGGGSGNGSGSEYPPPPRFGTRTAAMQPTCWFTDVGSPATNNPPSRPVTTAA